MIVDMTDGNPFKHIVWFSIPLLIGNIFQQLYNISDLVIVGRYLGANAFAAVGAVAPLFFLITFILIGLTNGFAVVTGQRYGAKDMAGVKDSVIVSLFLSIIITLLFTVVCTIFINPILHVMNIPQSIYHDAFWYIEIIILGLILSTFYNLFASIIRALGDSKTPLYFLIFAAVMNVFLVIFFVNVLHMGVPGSAIALILSEAISIFPCILFIKRKFPMLYLRKKDLKIKFDKNFYKSAMEHLRIGLPMGAQFSIIGISVLIVQAVCNSFGEDVIVSFSAAMRIEQMATMPMASFAVALTAFVAQNYGAKNFKRIKTGVNLTSLINIVIGVFAALIMRFYGAEIVGIFIGTSKQSIIQIAHQYLVISTLFYFFLGQMFIFRNSLQGMGATVIPLIACTSELVMRTFAVIFLAIKLGYVGIFYSGPIAWVTAAIIVTIGYYTTFKHIAFKAIKS